jgi:hypothetical protein
LSSDCPRKVSALAASATQLAAMRALVEAMAGMMLFTTPMVRA